MSRNLEIRRSMLTELLEGQPVRKKQRTSITAPISTLLLDGQRALEDKRYSDAVLSLSDAIGNTRDRKADLLYLYDLRASAYMKLGNTEGALKDAKQMIRLDRADHRGYLKCAQIEKASGNLKEAIRICQYGLNSINQNDKVRQSLEMYLLRLREAQKNQIIFEKSTDPMQVLPSELLELLLLFFNYREVVAIMRVCRAWRNRLRMADVITQSIDSESTRKTLKHEHIKTAFNRLGKNPRKLYLSRLNENAAYYVSTQLKSWFRWESMRSLTIDDAKVVIPVLRYEKFGNLREICFKQVRFRMGDVNDVLQRCPLLEHATFLCDFEKTPLNYQERNLQPIESGRLRSLKLGGILKDGQTQFRLSFDNTKPISANLERLELKNVFLEDEMDLSMHSKLTSLALRETTFTNLKFPPTLEHFLWAASHRTLIATTQEAQLPASNIQSLDLDGQHSIKCMIHLLGQGLSRVHLRRVALTSFVSPSSSMIWSNSPQQDDLHSLVRNPGKEGLSNVENLTLRDDNLRDENQATVFRLFPNVRHLELESCSITEQFVAEHIKSKDSVLRSVVFRNCPQVSNDFYKWAQARQVEVEHVRQSSISSSFATAGRRVRYE